MNSFGHKFRISIFGESHGPCIGVVMDGVMAGIALTVSDFEDDLARRRAGAQGTTPRRETDLPEIVSGVFEGYTTGAPLAILFRNEDTRSGDYDRLKAHPRPSHADFVAAQKFDGHNDPRGGGHFSGRLTLCLVAAGVVAKKQLRITNYELRINSTIKETGDVEAAMRDGDSVGGVIECRAEGVPVGLGEPFFDSFESVLSHLLFAIPGVKGVEFGSGFPGAALRGSENNDLIINDKGTTATNNSGGVNGGISNGNPIVVRVAVKPTASIAKPQNTWNFATGRIEPLTIGGRHDACIALRAGVVVEAAMAIVLADFV